MQEACKRLEERAVDDDMPSVGSTADERLAPMSLW